MTMYRVPRHMDLAPQEQTRTQTAFNEPWPIPRREELLTAEPAAERPPMLGAERKQAREAAADEHARVMKAEAEAQRVAKAAEEVRHKEHDRAQSVALVGAMRMALGQAVPVLVEWFSAAHKRGQVGDGAARFLAPALADTLARKVAAALSREETARAVLATRGAVSCESLDQIPDTLERLVRAVERVLLDASAGQVTAAFAVTLDAPVLEVKLREAGEKAQAEALKAQAVLLEHQKKTRLDAAYEHLAPQLAKRLSKIDGRAARVFVDTAQDRLFAEDGSVRTEYIERDGRVRAALRVFLMEPRTEWGASPVYLDQLKEGFGWILEREWVDRQEVVTAAASLPTAGSSESAAPGPGVPLPKEVRNKAEQSLGQSFGDVRVHPDSATAGGAPMAAVGKQVHLRQDAYQPDTQQGQMELMHELAHVAQQRGQGEQVPAGLDPAMARGLLEADAGWVAEATLRGEPAAVFFSAPPGMWQGFEAWEHRDIGQKGGGGRMLKLDSGESIAFEDVVWLAGDLFGSVEGLKKAPPRQIQALLAVVEKQQAYARQGGGRPRAEQQAKIDTAFQDHTKERERTRYDHDKAVGKEGDLCGQEVKSFETLANENKDHLAGGNLNMWGAEHEAALAAARLARTDPIHREQHLNEALLHEAFGAHFLTDAFAAGHLVHGERGRQFAERLLAAEYDALVYAVIMAAQGDPTFTASVPRGAVPNPGLQLPNGLVAGAFALSVGIAHSKKGVLPSLLLKVVHDELNERGMEVRNRRGDQWYTAGDVNLSKVPRTYELAAEAVRLGREEVEAVADGKAWGGMPPEQLVPSEVDFGGKWISLEKFSRSQEIFLSILRPLVFDPTPNNRLYGLVRAYMVSVAKSKTTEALIAAGRAVGHGAAWAGQAMKSIGRTMSGMDVPASGPALDGGTPSGGSDEPY